MADMTDRADLYEPVTGESPETQEFIWWPDSPDDEPEFLPAPPVRAHELATMPYPEYLASPEWRAKVRVKREEAGHRCVVCDSSRRLEVHHRTYRRRGNELRGDLTVLCHECHSLFHGKASVQLVLEGVA